MMPKFTSIESDKPLSATNSRSNYNYNLEAATLEYFQQYIAGAVGNMWPQYEENMKSNIRRHGNKKI